MGKYVIPTLAIISVALNAVAVIFAVSWAQAPFPGSFFYPRMVVSDVFSPDWAGRQQQLETGDRLLAVDGQPVASGRDLSLLLRTKSAGDSASFDFESSTLQQKTVTLPLARFSTPDLVAFFWLPYGIGLIYLLLGLAVYRLRGLSNGGDVFVAFCVFVSVMAGGVFDLNTLHFLSPVWAVFFPLTGAALIHLATIFPASTRLSRRMPWFRVVPYVIAAGLGAANLYAFYLAPDTRTYLDVRLWNFALVGLAVPLFLALQLYTRITSFTALIRRQTMLIFWGGVIAFGPVGLWAALNVAGVSRPLTGLVFILVFLPFIVFPITVAYAMLRYRLLDLDIVFNRGVVYALLTLLVTVFYFLVVSVLGHLLQDTFLFRNPIILAIFVFLLVVSIEPLKQWLQAGVNRVFQRESADYQSWLQEFGRNLSSSPLESPRILEMFATMAENALQADRAMVFMRDANQGVFAIRHPESKGSTQGVAVRFGLSDDLAQWLADNNQILQLSPDGSAPANVRVSTEELARLNMLNIVLCVPLLGSERLLGWLALGLKTSGQPYSGSDLSFLATLASQTTIALENAQLLEDANRRAAELETLQKISVEIQSQTDPDILLTRVVQQATELLRAEGGLVFMLEPEGKTLKVVVSYNLDKDYCQQTIPPGTDIAGRVIALGESVIVDNYHNFAGRSEIFRDARFGAVLGVPLRWGGEVRGVLYLIHRPHGRRFNESDIWLMELFAIQAGIALDQSWLLQKTQHSARQLATLSEVSMAVSATLDLPTSLKRVMDLSVEILHAEAGSLLLADPNSNTLTFEVVLGPAGEELLGVKTPIGKGIVGTVAQTSEPLIINDVSADPRWNVEFDEDTEFRTKDLLCVPMIAHNRVVGVIEVINKLDGTTFTQDECNLLMSFAAQAAIAIENAQIFTRTDQALAERVQELQTLQMFDQELQTSLELKKVLEITLTHTMDALGLSMGLMGIVKEGDEPGIYLLAQRGMPMEMGRYRVDPWPLTRGVMGRVARTGEAEIVNDITQAKDYIPKTHRTRSLLVAPVKREDKVIGVINLESTDTDYFTSDDLSFITILLNQAAIAIDNALLFEKVRQANQAKSEFMSTASHELKIPMTSIKGYAKLLQMGAGGSLTEKQDEFMGVITSNVDRMNRLVSDLLDVSRIEAGRIRLEIEDVQLRDVVNDVVETVKTQIQKKKLNLSLELEESLPEFRADYNRMVQIVTNLVSNAYKYTPEGGQITVRAHSLNGDASGISLTVEDSGYGISEEDQAMLFTNFFRSSDQNIRNEPGTGLGLAITKKMIESHGGELTLKSELGHGSAFTVLLPLESKIPPGVEVTQR
ncbi:MAG: hypothetical protein Kow0031_14090 [Anaerolineae bacterium]